VVGCGIGDARVAGCAVGGKDAGDDTGSARQLLIKNARIRRVDNIRDLITAVTLIGYISTLRAYT
jgi:hypothetical protein